MNPRSARLIAAGLLLLALLPWPSWYDQGLRWACCGAFAWSAWRERSRPGWFWTFLAAAVVFNPVAPFRFGWAVWRVIKIAAAAVCMVSVLPWRLPVGRGRRRRR